MKLHVLGSSSAGNGYLLDNGKTALLIEAGVGVKSVCRCLNYDLSRLQGVLISHEHGDHAKHACQLIKRGIHVYTSKGTAKNLKDVDPDSPFLNIVDPYTPFHVGAAFKVMAIRVNHDAAEPFGFFIEIRENGDRQNLIFATDTKNFPFEVKEAQTWMIECNYSESILAKNVSKGIIDPIQANRVRASHLSLSSCAKALLKNDLRHTQRIVLLHLSDRNSNAEQFQNTIDALTGRPTYVAEPGLEIELI